MPDLPAPPGRKDQDAWKAEEAKAEQEREEARDRIEEMLDQLE